MIQIWYALTVMPRREQEAADALTRRGFGVYVPLVRKYRKVNKYVKRKELKRYALLPGYVFLQSQSAYPAWYRILNSRWVRGAISVEDRPLRIPLNDMDALIAREHKGEFTAWSMEQFMRSNHEVTVGQDADIVIGPLAGQRGKVVSITEEVAGFLLEMFGTARVLKVPLESLEAA